MTQRWSNKVIFLLLYLSVPHIVEAQQFHYMCLTDTVRQTGFYSIPVTPEMSAHMQMDFRDIRIRNGRQQTVPYIIRNNRPKRQNILLKPFTIIENKLDDSGRSAMVIEKKVGYPVANLTLTLKNASVSRYASLSGSNDYKNWFIISEHILINRSYESLADSSIQSISFPSSSYQYFRLIVDNSKKDPLNIMDVGYSEYMDDTSMNHYTPNPSAVFVQTDSSNGISYIKVLQQQPFRVDQVSFDISGPKYFSRECAIVTSKRNTRKKPNYFYELARFNISSTSGFSTLVPAFKTDSFYVTVENGDNPPLTIKNVHTAQEYHELVAWLETGKPYTILMDDDGAVAPTYDLQQFQDSIPAVVKPVAVSKIEPVSTIKEPEKDAAFPQKWIWVIMAGAVALLAVLTWRLTSEMRKQ